MEKTKTANRYSTKIRSNPPLWGIGDQFLNGCGELSPGHGTALPVADAR
jgi:hypothetical protein